MDRRFLTSLCFITAISISSVAHAQCSGGLGRGWASSKGAGQYEMAASDQQCLIGFASFIDPNGGKTPATKVKLTSAPKSGKIGIGQQGVVYTPNKGFRGTDKFCTSNSSDAVKGKSLKGCVSISVN